MKRIIMITGICLILFGCSAELTPEQQYTKYIEQSKAEMKNGEWEEAILSLESAKEIDYTTEVFNLLNEARQAINNIENLHLNFEKAKVRMEQHDYANAISMLEMNITQATKFGDTDIINQSNLLLEEARNNLEQEKKVLEIEKPTLDMFIGEWGDVPTSSSGYGYLRIEPEDERRVKIYMESTQDPPQSRTASIEVFAYVTPNGELSFTYDDDSWGNAGEGIIELKENNQLSVTVEQTFTDPSANWSLHDYGDWYRIDNTNSQASDNTMMNSLNSVERVFNEMNQKLKNANKNIWLDASSAGNFEDGYKLEYNNVSILLLFDELGVDITVMEISNDKLSTDFVYISQAAIAISDSTIKSADILTELSTNLESPDDLPNVGSATLDKNGQRYQLSVMDLDSPLVQYRYNYTFRTAKIK